MRYSSVVKNSEFCYDELQIMNANFLRLFLLIQHSQFLRFIIVGALATAIHYGIYLALFWTFNISENNEWEIQFAYSTGYAVSFICNYILSLKWTFQSEQSVKKGMGFGFSHATNYAAHVFLLWLLTSVLGVDASYAPIYIFIVLIPTNFLMVRFFLK